MLRPTLRSWANLLLTTVIFLPILASAKASKEKAIDISIIEQSDTLIPYMTTSQRIQFLKLEAAIEDAKSKRRSGQYLAETKPSTFDPDRDIKSIVNRGEQMIDRADLSIRTNQKDLVSLLATVEAQKAIKKIIEEARFDYVLESSTFEEAMAELDELVSRMEDGELSLDDSLKAFERGVMLTRKCQEALSQAELRVKTLTDADTLEELSSGNE